MAVSQTSGPNESTGGYEYDDLPGAVAGSGANEDLLTDHGWYAEVEARSRIRSKFPEAARLDFLYPVKPDVHRAEYFYPEDRHEAYCDNEALKRIAGIEVEDSHIVIPYETVRELETDPRDLDELDDLVWEILSHMRVRETEVEGSTSGEGVALRYTMAANPRAKSTADTRRTDPRPIYVEVPPDHHWCELQRIKEKRDREDRDIKGIITARDSQTGTGKTTLAEQLALDWDPEWSAERATLDADRYVKAYLELPPGAVLLGDEMEQMADNRRSMSGGNVKLTTFWATMRAWQVSTIATLPSTSALDKRLKELADFRINVIERGLGVVYKTKVPDHGGEPYEVRLHRIRWGDLSGHPAHEDLKAMKEGHMPEFLENFDADGEDMGPEITATGLPLDVRNELMFRLYHEGELTQGEIGSLSWVNLDTSSVSKVLKRTREELGVDLDDPAGYEKWRAEAGVA